jgi:serine/threonine protein phosphatase PrpC
MSALRVEAAGGSHVGRVRSSNEDSYASLPGIGLFAVADGIGGKPGGEVASRMAIDIIRRCLEEDDTDDTWPLPIDGEPARDEARLIHSLRRANRDIYAEGRRNAGVRGMGTTFAGVLLATGRAYIAHVGDSRVYRFRRGHLEQMTRDHTVLEDFLRQGRECVEAIGGLDPDIAYHLTRALGTDSAVDIETRVEQPEPGDILLVCSDGLWGALPEDKIAAALAWRARSEVMVAGLIGGALEHGGPDNVTCVVVRFGEN